MTKQEIINKIQELVNYHLGHSGLCLDSYTRLSKLELEKRLVNAEQMHEVDIQAKAIRDKYTDKEVSFALVFPEKVGLETKSEMENYRRLCNQANDLWLKV